MFKYALILALIPALTLAEITFISCKEGGPLPTSISVAGCDETRCVLYNRVPVQITGLITAHHDSHELTTGLKAFLGIVSLPMELPEDVVDGCKALEGGCPVKAGETRGLSAMFVVDSEFSGIKADIELSITNEQKQLVMCLRTSIYLENP